MSNGNVTDWLKRISGLNQAGKFPVPRDINQLPCGCGRFKLMVNPGNGLRPNVMMLSQQSSETVPNKMFYVNRASLENKLTCASCDRVL